MSVEACQLAAARWLADAHREPQEPLWEWSRQDVALLPAGPQWDAVKVPSLLIHRVAGTEAPRQVYEALSGLALSGPIFVDPYQGIYYMLVPSGTAISWNVPDVDCIGNPSSQHYLGVPHPSRLSRPGLHWIVPPDGSGQLVNPDTLQTVLMAVAAQLADELPMTRGNRL